MRLFWLGIVSILISMGCRATHHQITTNCQRVTHCPNASIELPALIESATIEDLVDWGLSHNPRIAEAELRIKSLCHRIPQVLSLPDPVLNSTTHLAPVETAAGRQAFALGLSQKFTDSDRRKTKARIIKEEIAAAKAKLRETELDVAQEIRAACWQILLIQRSIEIVTQDAAILSQVAENVEKQYEVNPRVKQSDVLDIQVEQSKLQNELVQWKQKKKTYDARLARLLHLDQHSELQILDRLQDFTPDYDLDALVAQAIQMRPDLQAQTAQVRRNQKEVCLARLENRPDVTIGLNWIATSPNGISPVANGDDAVLLGVGMNLPIRKNRIQGTLCEALTNKNASQLRLEGLKDQAAEEVFATVAKIESAHQMLGLLQNDMIPKSQRSLELELDEFAMGKLDFVTVIESWRSVLRYRLTEAGLQSQIHQLSAELASYVGQLQTFGSPDKVSETDFLNSEVEVRDEIIGE